MSAKRLHLTRPLPRSGVGTEFRRQANPSGPPEPGAFRFCLARLEQGQDLHAGHGHEPLVGDADLGDDGERDEVEAHVGQCAAGGGPLRLERGGAIAAKIPMIATTIINSMRVKPFCRLRLIWVI